jgi:hypothetical protein
MSLNYIKMPPQLIVGLYPDTLVETEIIAHEVQLATEQTVIEQSEHEQSVIEEPVNEQPVTQPVTTGQILKEQPITEQSVKMQPTVEETVMDVPTSKEQQQFDFLGKNKKQILIIAASDRSQYLPEHELKFLTSVLKACSLTTEDVAILNIKKQAADHVGLQSFFQYRAALLFGLEPQSIDLPMNFPQFQLQNFNKCTYLHAPALDAIEKDRGLKMKLWGCLKNLFSM